MGSAGIRLARLAAMATRVAAGAGSEAECAPNTRFYAVSPSFLGLRFGPKDAKPGELLTIEAISESGIASIATVAGEQREMDFNSWIQAIVAYHYGANSEPSTYLKAALGAAGERVQLWRENKLAQAKWAIEQEGEPPPVLPDYQDVDTRGKIESLELRLAGVQPHRRRAELSAQLRLLKVQEAAAALEQMRRDAQEDKVYVTAAQFCLEWSEISGHTLSRFTLRNWKSGLLAKRGRTPVLDAVSEANLAKALIACLQAGFLLSKRDVCALAKEVICDETMLARFGAKQTPGVIWLHNFIQRVSARPELESLRFGVSHIKICSTVQLFNRDVINSWYDSFIHNALSTGHVELCSSPNEEVRFLRPTRVIFSDETQFSGGGERGQKAARGEHFLQVGEPGPVRQRAYALETGGNYREHCSVIAGHNLAYQPLMSHFVFSAKNDISVSQLAELKSVVTDTTVTESGHFFQMANGVSGPGRTSATQ